MPRPRSSAETASPAGPAPTTRAGRTRSLKSSPEQGLEVAVPVALENLAAVVVELAGEEVRHLRIGALDLRPRRVAVVGEVEAAAARERQIDQPPEGHAGPPAALLGVVDVEVHHRAGVWLAGPGQE